MHVSLLALCSFHSTPELHSNCSRVHNHNHFRHEVLKGLLSSLLLVGTKLLLQKPLFLISISSSLFTFYNLVLHGQVKIWARRDETGPLSSPEKDNFCYGMEETWSTPGQSKVEKSGTLISRVLQSFPHPQNFIQTPGQLTLIPLILPCHK